MCTHARMRTWSSTCMCMHARMRRLVRRREGINSPISSPRRSWGSELTEKWTDLEANWKRTEKVGGINWKERHPNYYACNRRRPLSNMGHRKNGEPLSHSKLTSLFLLLLWPRFLSGLASFDCKRNNWCVVLSSCSQLQR